MSGEKDLFTKSAFDALIASGIEVIETARTVYTATITIDGQKFDAVDMQNLLDELEADWGNIVVTDVKTATMLQAYGVISSAGSRSFGGAEKGPYFAEFKKMIFDKIKTLPHSDVLVER